MPIVSIDGEDGMASPPHDVASPPHDNAVTAIDEPDAAVR